MTEPTRVADEVTRLHDFFAAWFAGESDRTIEEFSGALDERFSIVGPDGNVTGHDEIVAAVARGHGKVPISITVENFHVVNVGGAVVCRYHEVQTAPQTATRRIATAVMVIDADTPGGYRWVSVHETWAES